MTEHRGEQHGAEQHGAEQHGLNIVSLHDRAEHRAEHRPYCIIVLSNIMIEHRAVQHRAEHRGAQHRPLHHACIIPTSTTGP